MGVKYAYYRCQNRKCPAPVNVRRQDLKDALIRCSATAANAGYLRLFHKVVLDVWNAKQANYIALIHKFEKQVNKSKERKRKLIEAFYPVRRSARRRLRPDEDTYCRGFGRG